MALPWHSWWAMPSVGACWASFSDGSAVLLHQGWVSVRALWGKGDPLLHPWLPLSAEESDTWVPCLLVCLFHLPSWGRRLEATKHPFGFLTQRKCLVPFVSGIVYPASLSAARDSGNKRLRAG